MIEDAQVTPNYVGVIARLARETQLREARESMAAAMSAGYRREVSREATLALAYKALAAGHYWPTSLEGKLVPRLEWDVAGGCEAAIPVEIWSRWSVRLTEQTSAPITVQLFTRCRRCMWCKNQRAWLWMQRAASECKAAPRTWFVTLTLSPDEQYAASVRARASVTLKGVDFEGLRESEKFEERVKAIGRDLTLWVKRIRKNSGARIRILIVAERHKSGDPHFHALIHETEIDRPVRKSILRESWTLGYSAYKLVDDPRSAAYVCKYLAKDASTRIRASFRYGSQPSYLYYTDSFERNVENPRPPLPAQLSKATLARLDAAGAGSVGLPKECEGREPLGMVGPRP